MSKPPLRLQHWLLFALLAGLFFAWGAWLMRGPQAPAPLMYENLSPKPYFGVPPTPAPAPTPAQERPLAHAQQPAPARPGLNSDYGLAWNAPQIRPPALEQTPLKLPIQQASR